MRAPCLAVALLCVTGVLSAQPKRVLYLSHSAGYRHDSIDVSKRVLADLAARSGKLEVVSTEDLSTISESSLRQFDAVLFFTSGELTLSAEQKAALLGFVRGGKGFAGVHSATDTLYGWPEYGEMIGGYFDGHPWVREVTIDVEDPENPFVKHLAPSFRMTEEIYQFRAFSRENVRVLMTLDTGSVDLRAPGVNRTDEDFALAWIRPYGSGRVFYTALGHFDDTWLDPRFQSMLLNALLWITGQSEAEAAPRKATASVATLSTLPASDNDTLAPGSIFTINGSGLTSGSSLAAGSLPLPVKLAGTSVRLNGKAVPLFEVSPSRVVAQAPYNLQAPADVVVITGNTSRSTARPVNVLSAVPGILAIAGGRSAGFIAIYTTGLGAVVSDIQSGAAPADQLVRTQQEPAVRIGGVPARVLFSGLTPGLVGVYQVNAEWPTEPPSGRVEVVLEAGGRAANFVLAE